jgi:hypothetical protein
MTPIEGISAGKVDSSRIVLQIHKKHALCSSSSTPTLFSKPVCARNCKAVDAMNREYECDPHQQQKDAGVEPDSVSVSHTDRSFLAKSSKATLEVGVQHWSEAGKVKRWTTVARQNSKTAPIRSQIQRPTNDRY